MDVLKKARELGLELPDEALKEYLKTPHGYLDLKAREKLRKLGYGGRET